MANLYILPLTKGLYNYKFEVTLDGIQYVVQLQYNSRKDGWFLSLYDYNNNALATGLKVVIGDDLLAQLKHIDGVPSGLLVPINFTDAEEANLENFGNKVFLTYIGDS